MKILLRTVFFFLGIGMLHLVTSAEAGQKLRKNETWCLETSMGRGGGTMTECTFGTLEQCIQSKVAHGDQCTRNPRLR